MSPDAAIAVTGASRGIGAEIAAELAGRGRRVACLSRSGDVSKEEDLRAAFQQVAQQAGGISGLVNNAGIHKESASRSFATADFEEMLRQRAVGVRRLARGLPLPGRCAV